jgi:methionyl-tRNA synthetase
LRSVQFGEDGSVSPEDFENRYTTELANEYGNLASRSLSMIGRYRDGVVPEARPAAGLVSAFAGLPERVQEQLDRVAITPALEEIWRRVRELNRYVQEEAPWQLAKDPEQAERLDTILYGLAEGLRVVSVLLHPVMPDATEKLLAALGREDRSLERAHLGDVPGGARIGELAPLFPRVEAEAAA